MALPAETILAAAGIAGGLIGLSWAVPQYFKLRESARELNARDWSKSAWGDVPAVPDDLFHNGTITPVKENYLARRQ